jgi:hypothetical protein
MKNAHIYLICGVYTPWGAFSFPLFPDPKIDEFIKVYFHHGAHRDNRENIFNYN